MKRDIYIFRNELYSNYLFTVKDKIFESNYKGNLPSIKYNYNSLETLSLFFRFKLTPYIIPENTLKLRKVNFTPSTYSN